MFKSINKVIRVLVISDFFLNAGWGLLSPIFAIFIFQHIATENTAEAARVAGFAFLCYWVTKSILQVPIGYYLDKNHGEKDDFLFMIFGMVLVSIVPFGYLISSSPWHIYIFQMIYGIGMAMVYPPWLAIFTRHIDKDREAFDWSIESTSIGFGAGIAGAVGGILVSIFNFRIVLFLVGFFTIFSTLLLLLVRKEMFSKKQAEHKILPLKPF